MSLHYRGFAPILILLVTLLISGSVVGGTVYFKDSLFKPSLQKISKEATVSATHQKTVESTQAANPDFQLPDKTEVEDDLKDKIMGEMAYIIDQDYQKYIKSDAYAYLKYKTPPDLSKLDFTSLGIKQSSKIKSFIQNELKYIAPANDYLLCAKFKNPRDRLSTAYFDEKVMTDKVGSEYQCFRMSVFKMYADGKIDDPTITNFDIATAQKIVKSTTFADPNIASVEKVTTLGNTLNALTVILKDVYTTEYDLSGGGANADINVKPGITKETGTVNFPYGFFSSEPQEWGFVGRVTKQVFIEERNLITFENVQLTLKVKFKSPVKLSTISNLFSNCQHVDCYSWTATGTTTADQTVDLVEKTISGVDSRVYSEKTITYDGLLKEVDITIERIENKIASEIVLKKIKFTYDQ